MSYKSIFATVLLAASTLAAPTALTSPSCSTNKILLTLPSNQTALAKQTGAPSFALLGVGFQNYTCTHEGTYTSVGAVAELFDISCLAGTFAYATVQIAAYEMWKMVPPQATSSSSPNFLTKSLNLLSSGQHYFVPTPSGTGVSPVWDMRSSGPKNVKGRSDAFVLAAKVANIPAPTGPNDVDWLQLTNVQGSLATAIYRTDTKGGQPPASCTVGSKPISVKYTSKYLLYGSTVA